MDETTTTAATEVVPLQDLMVIIIALIVVVAVLVGLYFFYKICCGVCNVIEDRKQEVRYRHRSQRERLCSETATASSNESKSSSVFVEEKIALVEGHSRLARETGLRLDDYPFIIDYSPVVLIPGVGSVLPVHHSSPSAVSPSDVSLHDGFSGIVSSDEGPETHQSETSTLSAHSPIVPVDVERPTDCIITIDEVEGLFNIKFIYYMKTKTKCSAMIKL